ncbi:MAG: response regulator [Chloroflexaceae bacterium]|nr:response regulator [Chloroflexaceae bacterium]
MSKERILIVEDTPDIANLLKIYFLSQGYEVFLAMRGQVALDICRKTPPHLALLDVGLPDMLGYDVGKALRASPRTRHIPIIFLTAYGERENRLKGLGEVQADYYMVKPFDIEEVHTIVKNQLETARRKNQSHPVTNLPTAEIINDQFRHLLSTSGWVLAIAHINGFEAFIRSYGAVVGEEVLEFMAIILNETMNERGNPDDFIGQMVVGADFVFTSTPERIKTICEQLIYRFDEGVGVHYNHNHRKQGYIEVSDDNGVLRQIPLMSLSIGVITSQDGPFYDIRELTETAEETRQKAFVLSREQGQKSLYYIGRAH